MKSAQGYEFLKGIPKRMREAVAKAVGVASSDHQLPNLEGSTPSIDDVYGVLPLDAWAE